MIQDLGVPAHLFETNDQILSFIAAEQQAHDVLITMSNGHFDHIQDQLTERLELVTV